MPISWIPPRNRACASNASSRSKPMARFALSGSHCRTNRSMMPAVSHRCIQSGSHRLVFSGSVLPAKSLVLFNVQRIFAPFPVCAFRVPSIADNVYYNPYFLHFISANEKSGTPGRASSKRKCPCKVKKTAIYGPVPPSVPKIRFCPSAVNGSAPIHQSYKKTISFLYKNRPSFLLWKPRRFILFIGVLSDTQCLPTGIQFLKF